MICDENVQFYIGLLNIVIFKVLFFYFELKVLEMIYWQGNEIIVRIYKNKGFFRKLSFENEFFVVLVCLKLGFLVEDIVNCFDIFVLLFFKIFNIWICFLCFELELFFLLFCREKV